MTTLTPNGNAVTVSAETVVRMWMTGSRVSIKDSDGTSWNLLNARGFGLEAVRLELFRHVVGEARRDLTLDVHPDRRLDALFY